MSAEEQQAGQHRAGRVVSVGASRVHRFSKPPQLGIRLLEGLGVEGDAHAGTTVRHRSRRARTPDLPNLRQVHLIAAELFEELDRLGHRVGPGDLGENITTRGIDLLSLPRDTLLRLGAAEIQLTGLRNPCVQINRFQSGLLKQVAARDHAGTVVFKAGVMAVVRRSGEVREGDPVSVVLPDPPHEPLQLV